MSLCRVVGYANINSNGVKTVSAGSVFTPVNGAKTFLLKEWKPDGVDYDDNFQLLSSDNASTIARYCYVTKACADDMAVGADMEPGDLDHAIGWWILGNVDWEDTEGTSTFRAGNTPINVGDSFLVACGGARDFTALSAGQVPTAVTSIERNNVKTPFFCNYLPVAVKLGNISIEGVDYDDNFQLLSSDNASTIARYCYVTKACADDMAVGADMEPGDLDHAIGWWILGNVDWEDTEGTSESRANGVLLGAGQGVLVAAGGKRDSITVSFPSALEATK